MLCYQEASRDTVAQSYSMRRKLQNHQKLGCFQACTWVHMGRWDGKIDKHMQGQVAEIEL